MSIKNVIYCLSAIIVIAIGAQIEFPINDNSYILSDFFVVFFALLLSKPWGVIATFLYLLFALLGLPILAEASGGLTSFTGNTFGYLVGFLLSAFLLNFYVKQLSLLKQFMATLIIFYLLLFLGTIWLFISNPMSLTESYQVGFEPYIVSAFVKSNAAVLLAYLFNRFWSSIFK